jgi:hypothetical protein
MKEHIILRKHNESLMPMDNPGVTKLFIFQFQNFALLSFISFIFFIKL